MLIGAQNEGKNLKQTQETTQMPVSKEEIVHNTILTIRKYELLLHASTWIDLKNMLYEKVRVGKIIYHISVI